MKRWGGGGLSKGRFLNINFRGEEKGEDKGGRNVDRAVAVVMGSMGTFRGHEKTKIEY